MEMRKVKMGLIGTLVLCMIFASNMEFVAADAFDCYDACITGCVQPDTRLMRRCEIKCGIRCDYGSAAQHTNDANTRS